MIVNRTRRPAPVAGRDPLTAAQAQVAADRIAGKAGAEPAETALRVHVEVAAAAEHDSRMTRRFAAAHPAVPLVGVPALPTDVHDLDGLRAIGDLLGTGSRR